MGLLDEIRKALESEKKSEFIDQILKEKGLFDALHDAGLTITALDPSERGLQRPFGVLSKVQKIDLIDLIELINRIKLIDEITLISTIATVGSMTLLDRITQLDKIHPDPPSEAVTNGTFETGDFTGWTQFQAYVSTQLPHSIPYSVHMYECWIRQDFTTPIPKSQILSAKFWAVNFNSYPPNNHWYKIGYSDSTEDTILFITTSPSNEFEQFDILSNIANGKSVSYIKFLGDTGQTYFLDDVSIIAEGAHTVIDRIVSMPAVTGTVSVTGSQTQLLLQRALTYDLIVQLRSDGVEIDPRTIRALTASDIVTVNNLLNPHPVSLASIPNPPNLDVALSTRALESGGNLAAILARLDVALSTRALESGGNLASIKAKTDNLDVLLSTRFKPTDSIGNTSFGATQATRTSLKVQPEREDIVSLGGVASPSAAGVQIVAASGSLVPKVYDAEYEGLADGLHYFYFGTSTSPTTKRFLSRNTKGVNSKTFVQPRVGAGGDGIYLYSSVAETNMPYDLGYKLE